MRVRARWNVRPGAGARRRVCGTPLLLLALALATLLVGCSTPWVSTTPAASPVQTGTPVSGKPSSGLPAGYLVTCTNLPAELPHSCTLRAVNATDGSARWTRHLDPDVSIVSADNQSIYGVLYPDPRISAGRVVAFNAADGAQRWTASYEDAMTPYALTADAIYGTRITASDGQLWLVALRAADGSRLWRTSLGQHATGQVLVDGGHVYVWTSMNGSDGPPDDHFVAVDAASGKIQWQTAVVGRTYKIAAANGLLYAGVVPGSTDPNVAALSAILAYNATTGAPLWMRRLDLVGIPRALVVTPQAVYTILDQRGRGGAVALGARTGQALWTTPLGKEVDSFAGLVSLGDTLYTATYTPTAAPNAPSMGHLYALNAATGAIASDQTLPNGGALQVGQFDGMLVLFIDQNYPTAGYIEALRPGSVTPLWSIQVDPTRYIWFQPRV